MFKRPVSILAIALALSSGAALAFVEDNDNFSFGNSLIDAVEKGNVNIVMAALQSGIDPNETGKFETTALQRAAMHGNNDIANILIQNGADINMRDYGGATALSIAAREGKNAVAQTLISKGADIDVIDAQGYSPLHRAIANRHVTVSKLLLNAGAEVNTVNNEGNSPLIDAVRSGEPEVVKGLLIKGANRTVKNDKGLDVIAYALKMGDSEIDSILGKSQQELMKETDVSSSSVVASGNVPAFLAQEANMHMAQATPLSKNISHLVKVPIAKVQVEDMAEPETKSAKNDMPQKPLSMQVRSAQVKTTKHVSPEPAFLANEPVIEMQAEENVEPFQVADLQLTSKQAVRSSVEPQHSSSNGLQRAPRLPAVAKQKEEQAAKAAAAAEQKKQMAEMKKAYQQGLQNIKPIALPADVERKSDTVQLAEQKPAPVVYNFQYEQPEEEINEAEPVTSENKADVPASMKVVQPAKLIPAPRIAAAAPVVVPQTVVYVAPQVTNEGKAYEAQVDTLMNSYAEQVDVKKEYNSEVDDLMGQLGTEEPAAQQTIVQPAPRLPAQEEVQLQPAPVNDAAPNYPRSMLHNAIQQRANGADSSYASEVDRILSEGTLMNLQPEHLAQIQPAVPQQALPGEVNIDEDVRNLQAPNPATAKNPVLATGEISTSTNMNDYGSYKNNLLQDINMFYNTDSASEAYGHYDISGLNAERVNNLGMQTAPEATPAEAPTDEKVVPAPVNDIEIEQTK